MALAGGETAQMADLYRPGDYDLAGTIVGVVEEADALHGDRSVPGDVLLAYASSGLHTNGYTLARRIIAQELLDLGDQLPGTGRSVGDVLLDVHRSYFTAVYPLVRRMHGLAHITGGGIPGNLIRVLPEGCAAVIESRSWTLPPLFEFLQQRGGVSAEEMRNVFNLGVGLIAILPEREVPHAQEAAREVGVDTWILGHVTAGARSVRFA
jgi:phosphoribosylformylglycinamidine cyclo-ligase